MPAITESMGQAATFRNASAADKEDAEGGPNRPVGAPVAVASVAAAPPHHIGNGPESHNSISRANGVRHDAIKLDGPRQGSTYIPLDGDDDDDSQIQAAAHDRSEDRHLLADCTEEAAQLDRRRQQNLERATQLIRRAHPQLQGAVVSKLTAYWHRKEGARHLIVVDDIIPMEVLHGIYQSLSREQFRRTEFARPDTRQYKHSIVEYNVEDLRDNIVHKMIEALVDMCFPPPAGAHYETYRIYTNAVMYSDVAFVHRDSDNSEHITALLYPNMEWKSEYGGETMFYDEDQEVIDAVEPRPGRLVLFHGSLMHKGSPPGRLFYEMRYTTAFKFAPPEGPRRRMDMRRPVGGNDPEPQ